MRTDVARMLEFAAPWTPEVLLSEAHRLRIASIASQLPALWDIVVFECRLAAGDHSVDFLLGAVGAEGDPAAIIEALDGHEVFPALGAPDGPAIPLMRAWAESPQWRSSVPLTWLEYDVPIDGAPNLGTGVGVDPTHYDAYAPSPHPSVHRRAAQWAYSLITNVQAPLRLMEKFEACAAALPGEGTVSYIAPLKVRGSDLLRVVAVMPIAQVRDWLRRIGWAGSDTALDKLFGAVGTEMGRAGVQIEIGEDGVDQYLATETYLVDGERSRAAALAMFGRLHEAGVIDMAKAEATIDWLGSDTIDDPDEVWLVGINRSAVVKTVLRPGPQLEVKSYLEYSLSRPLMPYSTRARIRAPTPAA